MSTPSDRLRQAREAAGFQKPVDAARAMGISRFTYAQHESGLRGFRRDSAILYARKFKVSLEWLLTGRGNAGNLEVPVVAFVGAGAEINPMDDHAKGSGLEMVPPPPGVTECVAAVIKGDSMHPLRDGWLIFWVRDYHGVNEDCIGKLCVAQILDGPCLVKEVHKGSKAGFFNLLSWNAPARHDVRLEWAAPVIDIRPT